MKRAIVVGASSGIGFELARILAREGYYVGVTGRRIELLEKLKAEFADLVFVKEMDVSQSERAASQLRELIGEMGGLDLLVISAGVGFVNPELSWDKEKATIDTNVTGFAVVANVGMEHFVGQKTGHLVNISSLAALRGSGDAPAYSASKAFSSNYMQGLRQKVTRLGLPITITDTQPGFVDTAMAKSDKLFWMASAEKAAQQIYSAIKNRRSHAYVTRRWRVVAWLLRNVPDRIYNRL
ncbi:MAG TPA: SDR family NAD(P)-dependent oxidoreductase [Abditibacteriaceae bacterium]|jgi:short-subunit dehydrogenase